MSLFGGDSYNLFDSTLFFLDGVPVATSVPLKDLSWDPDLEQKSFDNTAWKDLGQQNMKDDAIITYGNIPVRRELLSILRPMGQSQISYQY